MISEIKSSKKNIRNFSITLSIILMIIGAILFWKKNTDYSVFMIIGVFLLSSGILIPIILKPIYYVWMIISNILGWIMTHLVLSLLFYLIFTPIGLTVRLFGKQFLELKWDKSQNSYWKKRTSKQWKKEEYERQF